jgi:hypothetical protein
MGKRTGALAGCGKTVAEGESDWLGHEPAPHPGFSVSHEKRTQVEEIFGWVKTVGLRRKVTVCGVRQVGWRFTCATGVYTLLCGAAI